MLEADPTTVNAKGGALRWEPLLYACYSRMDGNLSKGSTLEVARLLLAHGADPNAGFLWGATYAFTALTGAFGEGEDGINQPPHPRIAPRLRGCFSSRAPTRTTGRHCPTATSRKTTTT